jgi:hypothetical protein
VKLRIAAKFSFKERQQRAIQFDHVQFSSSGKQLAGECASPRADLDDAFSARLTRRFGNEREGLLVFQEMLAEFARQTSV